MNTPLKALTGLRFFAAFLVVLHHFGTPQAPLFAHNVMSRGFVSVTLFFVLSGFILSYRYADDNGEINATKRDFWVARVARIYPVYVLGFLLYAHYAYEKVFIAGASATPHVELATYGVAALGLVQSWSTVTARAWNPPGWSLSAEAFFYLMFPFIAPTILKLGLRRLVVTAVVLWALSLSAQLAYATGSEFDHDFWIFNPLLRFPEFLLGIVLGRFWIIRGPARFEPYAAAVSIATAAAIVAMLAFGTDEAWFFNGALAPLMMLLVYSLAAGRGPLARFLASKPLVLLGEASYSLYILHWPLWLALSAFLQVDLPLVPKGRFLFLVCLVLTVGASILSFKLLEQPANRFIRRVFSRKGQMRGTVPVESGLVK